MRLSTFNVENMFQRARAMNRETWAEERLALEDYSRLSTLIQEPEYTEAVKTELLQIMARHDGLLTAGKSEFLRLRDIRGKLLYRPRNKPVEIRVSGRRDWIGWFELEREPVKETATENTGRIIGLLDTDILCVVEAEDRTGLKRFNADVLPTVDAHSFDQVMLIDGNDDRGIDVGIMTRRDHRIIQIRSHVDDVDDKGIIFSRDCAEYEVKTAQGNRLLLLVNHFKSKGNGKSFETAVKRRRQAGRVREIYSDRINEGFEYIAIAGDLNEVPSASPLDPLLRQGSDLTDVMVHPRFLGDERPGTFGNGTKSGKLDYVLMSPKLSAKVTRGGIERRGVWGGRNGTLFPHLPTIQAAEDAASDHAALWVEIDI
ncbi:MAG: hypothetical protein J0H48_08415 [Nitrosospira multiformis]|nr:hypothetical protein [Nitrosospira multiformis]